MRKVDKILYGTSYDSRNTNIKKVPFRKIHDRVYLILSIKYEEEKVSVGRRIMAVPDKMFNNWSLSAFKGVFNTICKNI